MIRGLVLGKFLPYHLGHAHLIREARRQVDDLVVLVCTLAREPIDGRLRFDWIRRAHPDCTVVHVTDDVPQAPDDDPEFWPIWTALIARNAGRVDRVFTSEPYGDELARRVGATHTCVDLERGTVPTSGSAIRADAVGHWQFIPRDVRPALVRRVAILGAESTGKTTLAQQLAERFGTVWVPEFGREYCETRDARMLTPADFEAIARGQLELEDRLAFDATHVLVCDTELHTTCTWSDMIVGSRPAWMTVAARARRYDAILLLEHDVPWVDDGTRVLATRRPEHTQRLREELEAAGRSYDMLTGSFGDRLAHAIELVQRALAPRSDYAAP